MWTRKSLLHAICASLLFASCGDASDPNLYNGTGILNLSINVLQPTGISTDVPSPGMFAVTLSRAGSEDGAAARWSSFDEFPQSLPYFQGEYVLTASYPEEAAEGFDCPWFAATETALIAEGETTDVVLTATLQNIPITVSVSEAFTSAYPDWQATVHAEGGSYIEIPSTETRTAFVNAAPLTFSIKLADNIAMLRLAKDIAVSPGQPMHFSIDLNKNNLSLSCNDADLQTIELTDALLSGRAADVSLTVDDPLSLLEQTLPDPPAEFIIDSPSAPAEAILTITSKALSGAPSQIDLCHPSAEARAFLEACGMELPTIRAGKSKVNISEILNMLHYVGNSDNVNRFSLVVTDEYGRQSEPVTLRVNTLPAEIRVISATDAIIGINIVDIIVAIPDGAEPSLFNGKVSNADGSLSDVKILEVTRLENGNIRVTVEIPDGNGPTTILAYYGNELKGSLVVQRVSPKFSLTADAFARSAILDVSCAEHPDLMPTITRLLQLTIDQEPAVVFTRDEDAGRIHIIGLEPQNPYTISATIQPQNPTASTTVRITTEAALQLPNGNFDDTKRSLVWKNMPSGGRYSQNLAEIFNCQNLKSFQLDTPLEWANTNAKTFNTAARNINTWYVQPSVFTIVDAAEGDYAVELVSTGFDPDGEQIPDYLQTQLPFVRYSRNIPRIAHRAAAKIFLGSYAYSAPLTEVYNEGISFKSRPSSLNGVYSYQPCSTTPSDRGIIIIEVLDESNNVIARSSLALQPASGYTAFSIPITYPQFGVKASRIKVMCSSSVQLGDIDHESSSVPLYFDPVTSSATGSRLRLDNFTLAY